MLRMLCGTLCALVAWTSAQAQVRAEPPAEPIRVGVSGPFSGSSGPIGRAMLDGIRIAARQINAQGGLLGRELILVERDDEASNERGAQVAQTLIAEDKVVATIGMVNTGVALASQRHYQDARIPMITAVASGSFITRQFAPPEHPDNFIFRVAASDALQAEAIVAEAVDRRALRRVAIFHDATNYGQLGRDDLEAALARRGLAPVAIERIQLRQQDMGEQIRRARASDANVVLIFGFGPELAHLAHALQRIGWRPPLIGSWTISMASFIDTAGSGAEGVLVPLTFIADAQSPRQRAFLEAWRRDSGSAAQAPPSAAAQGYDAMLILAAAIKQAGNTSGDALREALESLRGPVYGTLRTHVHPFDKREHELIRESDELLIGVVRDGQVRFAREDDRTRMRQP